MTKTLIYLVVIFFGVASTFVHANEKYYGSFIYNSDIPNALFFIDKIDVADTFELRKALRNHPIDTLVLASPGGVVWEGLSMAGIIFDRKIRVFVPESAICASACTFMFFGGNERLAEGGLGVHQFASSDGKNKEVKEQTQAQSQFTVSEIIGFLNEFETPRFVFERMFEDREMYWFNDAEKRTLNSELYSLDALEKEKLINYYTLKSANGKDLKEVAEQNSIVDKPLNREHLVKLIQSRLNEIGCNAGSVDGVWGQRTNAAAIKFAKKAGISTSIDNLISEEFIKALNSASLSYCPRIKSLKGFLSIYEVTCDGSKGSNSPWKITHHKSTKSVTVNGSDGSQTMFRYVGLKLPELGIEGGRLFLNENGYVVRFTFRNEHCNLVEGKAR